MNPSDDADRGAGAEEEVEGAVPEGTSEPDADVSEEAEAPEHSESPEEADAPEQPASASESEGQGEADASAGASAAEDGEAPEAAEPSAGAEPEAEGGTEPAPAPAEQKPEAGKPEEAKGKRKEAVPGANLEPIAITEERELTAEERARLEAEEEERASREAAAVADETDELPRRAAVAVPTDASIQATGKRKSSVARVLLRAGGGAIEVNGRGLEDYFPRPHHQSVARQPLVSAGYEGSLDVRIRVHGGGITGQAGAIRQGIARALCELDPELRRELKKRGMLTRDAREKERRKAGLKKARKRPQFSKR